MDRYMNAFKEFKKKFQNSNNIDGGKEVVTQNLEDNKSNNKKKNRKQKKLKKKKDKKQKIEGDHNKGSNAKNNSKPLSSLAKLKQRDPSIKYMKNPLQTPKILKPLVSERPGGWHFGFGRRCNASTSGHLWASLRCAWAKWSQRPCHCAGFYGAKH